MMPRYFGNLPTPLVVAGSVFTVAFLGVTDFLTGPDLSFSIFYLIPVTIITLHAGFRAGIGIAILSAIVWGVADVTAGAQYSQWLIPYWNATVRLGYFSLHSYLLSKLLAKISEEERRALYDPLTNAASWRYFREYAAKVIEGARRSRKPLTAAFVDIDNFKTVNDTLGHDSGDEVLRMVASVALEAIRATDMVARVGGDEFAFLLPETGFEESASLLNRVKESLDGEVQRNGWPVSVSIGAVTFNSAPASVDAMLKRADGLMYTVKERGKNAILQEQWPVTFGAAAGGMAPAARS
ncbi:MAG: GGDEF domain-containing protein [Gemmatimonadetes bacterium]|nr:GGDEF domain-containing protein [Gemmatimonadota bacterium]